jgi:hypothetical protein
MPTLQDLCDATERLAKELWAREDFDRDTFKWQGCCTMALDLVISMFEQQTGGRFVVSLLFGSFGLV